MSNKIITLSNLEEFKAKCDIEYGNSGPQPAVAYEGTSLLPEGVNFKDWTLHRAIVKDDICWIVVSGVIINTTSSAISVSDLIEITLPADICSHIYRLDGTTCNQSTSGDGIVLLDFTKSNLNASAILIMLKSTEVNKLKLSMPVAQSATQNIDFNFNIRIPIFLDIGTVQQ